LDRARAADLVQRIEAAICTASTEAARQHLRRVAELGTREVTARRAEVWMIGDVEELTAEVKGCPLRQPKSSLKGKVSLEGEKAAQYIPPEITLLPSGCSGESGLIENLPPRSIGTARTCSNSTSRKDGWALRQEKDSNTDYGQKAN
jgi:hypothetical protein